MICVFVCVGQWHVLLLLLRREIESIKLNTSTVIFVCE